MTVETALMILLPVVLLIIVVIPILNLTSKNTWFCRWIAHLIPDKQSMSWDGENLRGKCPRCGRELIKGDTGTWYAPQQNEDSGID